MTAPSASSIVRFGSFEFDVLSGELRRSGMRVNLQDQPLRVLECLLERPGQLVSREDLRRRLWSGDTFVDFERGINAAVKRLREALGDSAETPRFIETLPKRGYRFIAPINPPLLATAGVNGEVNGNVGGKARLRSRRQFTAVVLGLAALFCVVIAAVLRTAP